MEKEGMVKVPVTDEDRKKPYFKYYERDVISMVPEKMPFAFGGPMTPMDAVPFTDRARILTDEGIGTRIGYTVMPDGTGYMADAGLVYGMERIGSTSFCDCKPGEQYVGHEHADIKICR